jgi:PKD repeat protein
MQWQSDDEPGWAVRGDEDNFQMNDIRYKKLPYTEFDPDTGARMNIAYNCGGFVQFQDTSQGAISWQWDFGDGATSQLQNPPHNYTYDSTYEVRLIVRDLYGLDTVYDSVTIIKSGFASAPADTAICSGDSIALTATGGNTYTWSPSEGLSCTNCQTTMAKPDITTTYAVRVDSAGCEDLDSVTVKVNQPLDPKATADPKNICQGNSTTLSANSRAKSYNWSPGFGIGCDTCMTTSASPTDTLNYRILITDSNNCPSRDTVTVNVFDAGPNAFFEIANTLGTSVGINNDAANYTSLHWDFGDGSTGDDSNPTYTSNNFTKTYSDTGTYTITLTTMNPCDTSVFSRTVELVNISESPDFSQSVDVYPNPNQGTFYVEMGEWENEKEGKIVVHNIVGEKVKETTVNFTNQNRYKIDIGSQGYGVYFVTIRTNNGVATKKVTVSK